MNEYPRKIESWETSDYRVFTSEGLARSHEKDIEKARIMSGIIEDGGSVATALNAVGRLDLYGKDVDILQKIRKDSGLTISYWQCRDEPGYSVRDCDANGQWWVGGDAGSWSGGYGARVSTTDLIRYARDTADRHGGELPPVWRRPNPTALTAAPEEE